MQFERRSSKDSSDGHNDDIIEFVNPRFTRVHKETRILIFTTQLESDIDYKFNPIGRLIGPRGDTIQRIQKLTKCQVIIRGKGSVRDPCKEAALRGRRGWEHLDNPLHALIRTAANSEQEADAQLADCSNMIKSLLKPTSWDEIKRQQLVLYAKINGTYRQRHQSTDEEENKENLEPGADQPQPQAHTRFDVLASKSVGAELHN